MGIVTVFLIHFSMVGIINFLSFSLQGGMRAVVWSDTFQSLVILGGLIAVCVIVSIVQHTPPREN